MLKEDVVGIVNSQGSFTQMESSVSKLQAYSHLFNKDAMSQFMQLAQEAKDVDEEYLEKDEDA